MTSPSLLTTGCILHEDSRQCVIAIQNSIDVHRFHSISRQVPSIVEAEISSKYRTSAVTMNKDHCRRWVVAVIALGIVIATALTVVFLVRSTKERSCMEWSIFHSLFRSSV